MNKDEFEKKVIELCELADALYFEVNSNTSTHRTICSRLKSLQGRVNSLVDNSVIEATGQVLLTK